MTQKDDKTRLLEAAIPHVVFDGWSDATLDAAMLETGIDGATVKSIFPRGAIDLAVAYHKRGDALMLEQAAHEDIASLRYSEKVARLVELRLDASDKEAVRKGMTIFAMPQNGVEGGRLMWETADAIWNALGDTSDDINWYSKRAILAGVYTATLAVFVGDESEGKAETLAFLDRRLEGIMRFEKAKAQLLRPADEHFSLARFLGRLRYPAA